MKKIVVLGGLFVFGGTLATDVNNAVNNFDGICAGIGVSMTHSENKADVVWNNLQINNPKIVKKTVDQFGGVVAVGYGKVLDNNLYVGGEVSLDASENKKFSGSYDWYGKVNYSGKIKGLTPSAVVKFGYYASRFNTLFYGRVGGAYVKSDFHDGYAEGVVAGNAGAGAHGHYANISDVVPVVGIGIEKKFGKYGIRLEGDYRFDTNKKSIEYCTSNQHARGVALPGICLKNRLNSYVIRMMATCNFH